eukprot:TRINITY_DN22788_c0_g2_i1.p1 TRINITY_DN22788_c0_g2~~TRINITY_DN22788_c0_g2_i1.p1  ORF type:complete len:1067 (+),score=166.73 TRINITY_DN22788_c0_g2_i1:55-3255(+)
MPRFACLWCVGHVLVATTIVGGENGSAAEAAVAARLRAGRRRRDSLQASSADAVAATRSQAHESNASARPELHQPRVAREESGFLRSAGSSRNRSRQALAQSKDARGAESPPLAPAPSALPASPDADALRATSPASESPAGLLRGSGGNTSNSRANVTVATKAAHEQAKQVTSNRTAHSPASSTDAAVTAGNQTLAASAHLSRSARVSTVANKTLAATHAVSSAKNTSASLQTAAAKTLSMVASAVQEEADGVFVGKSAPADSAERGGDSGSVERSLAEEAAPSSVGEARRLSDFATALPSWTQLHLDHAAGTTQTCHPDHCTGLSLGAGTTIARVIAVANPANFGLPIPAEIVSEGPQHYSNEYPAMKVLDDDGDTRGHIWLSPLAQPSWFVMDLKEVQHVVGFGVRNTLHAHHRDRWTIDYTIEVCNAEPWDWVTAAAGTLPKSIEMNHIRSSVRYFRYIRFTILTHGHNGGGLGYFAALYPEKFDPYSRFQVVRGPVDQAEAASGSCISRRARSASVSEGWLDEVGLATMGLTHPDVEELQSRGPLTFFQGGEFRICFSPNGNFQTADVLPFVLTVHGAYDARPECKEDLRCLSMRTYRCYLRREAHNNWQNSAGNDSSCVVDLSYDGAGIVGPLQKGSWSKEFDSSYDLDGRLLKVAPKRCAAEPPEDFLCDAAGGPCSFVEPFAAGNGSRFHLPTARDDLVGASFRPRLVAMCYCPGPGDCDKFTGFVQQIGILHFYVAKACPIGASAQLCALDYAAVTPEHRFALRVECPGDACSAKGANRIKVVSQQSVNDLPSWDVSNGCGAAVHGLNAAGRHALPAASNPEVETMSGGERQDYKLWNWDPRRPTDVRAAGFRFAALGSPGYAEDFDVCYCDDACAHAANWFKVGQLHLHHPCGDEGIDVVGGSPVAVDRSRRRERFSFGCVTSAPGRYRHYKDAGAVRGEGLLTMQLPGAHAESLPMAVEIFRDGVPNAQWALRGNACALEEAQRLSQGAFAAPLPDGHRFESHASFGAATTRLVTRIAQRICDKKVWGGSRAVWVQRCSATSPTPRCRQRASDAEL